MGSVITLLPSRPWWQPRQICGRHFLHQWSIALHGQLIPMQKKNIRQSQKLAERDKKDLQILRKVFQVHPLSSHMPSMDMENKNDRHQPGLWVEWVPEPLDPYYGNSLFCVNCIYYLLSGPMMGPFSRGSIITQAQKQSTVSYSVLVSLFLCLKCGSGSAWVLTIPASTCPSYANSCRFTQGEEISRGVS